MISALLIHQSFVCPKDAGATRHYELATRLVRAGGQFTVVASDCSYLTGQRVSPEKRFIFEETLDGVRILRTYTHPTLHKSFVWRVISFLTFSVTSIIASARAQRVGIVMGTTPPIFQAVSAWIVATVRRRPFLLEVRDLWPEFAIDMGVLKNRLLIALSRWLEMFLYARATHIVVNSPAYRNYLVNRGVPGEKISFIPNGVDVRMFDPASNGRRTRQEYNLGEKFVVTYAGALGAANDIHSILRAALRLHDDTSVHFLIVGDGKERLRLEAFAKAMHLRNVTFVGAQPKSRMGDLLAASDACIAVLKAIPMFATTYPNKVFDYMAAGRPTILGIDGVIRQVIDASGGGIFVPPGDDEAIAQAISDLKLDRIRGRSMGAAARQYVERQFDREEQAKAFITLLQALAA
jgi:glycosyltransferase involved in cell wall biosynthesis